MADDRDTFLQGTFPEGFVWSTATASYQIEGAYKEGGRSTSIWDTFCRTEGKVYQGDTGDVACDSYHKYEEDIKLMKDLGTSHYRFSIAWCRIIPDPSTGEINPEGVAYYNRVIDALLAAGITPFVTLYHWDLPQTLQDNGGWQNREIVKYFKDYARACFQSFGDRVKMWLTFNEQIVFVWLGHGNGEHAPGIAEPLSAPWKAAHSTILAHSAVYHMYDQEFKPSQKGRMGITYASDWCEPKDPSSAADRDAAERLMQLKLGWYAQPTFGNGDYPEVLKKQLAKKSAELGLPASPLPEFTEEEIKQNKGAFDFFGLNHYTSRLVSPAPEGLPPTCQASLMDAVEETDPSWTRGESSWLYVVPWGLRRLLKWIKDSYDNPPVFITENGFSEAGDELNDTRRIDYYRRYINEVLKAIKTDGCDVKAYTAWSLLDNFEWARGYSERFGLHHVNYNDPERKRTPKASAAFYAGIIKDNGFPA